MMQGRTGRVLGLVPARGGSKGIPRKNLAPVGGRPLISWTLEEAIASGVFDRLVVSTDSPEIAETAKLWGGEVPFLRPEALARDETAGIEPVLHALEALREGGYLPDRVMLLQPTSPLRTRDDIRAALELAESKEAPSVVSVCPAVPPPEWVRRVTPEGILQDYFPSLHAAPTRQTLGAAYALNGALYLTRTEVLIQERSFYGNPTYALIMPRERSVDIDTPWDLALADMIIRNRMNSL